MKNDKKREFRSSSILGLSGLLTLSAAMIAVPWNRQFQDSRVQAARQKAEVVGYQLVQIYRESIKVSLPSDKGSSRGPASVQSPNQDPSRNLRSVGTMGVDPWGEPYHYRILSTGRDGSMRILVWSPGPNKKTETSKLENESVALMGQPDYSGDDIGVVVSVSQK